jgi:hypothetical protein
MAMDFNTAREQRTFELVPSGTIAEVQINIKPGGAGPDGLLRLSKSGEAEMIDAAFTVVEGPYARRKFFAMLVVDGVTDNHKQAADISKGRIRAMLESARGIKPSDNSETAKQARCIDSYGDMEGLRFIARIGIERGKDGYKDRNIIDEVITPERKEWHAVEQVPQPATAPASPTTSLPSPAAAPAASGPIARPSWAS